MLQLIGMASCKETQKLQRWLKDRSVGFHFLDLKIKPLSRGELINVIQGLENAPKEASSLVDTQSKIYKEKGLAHYDEASLDLLIQFPSILKTPILRSGKSALAGFDPARLEQWKEQEKLKP